MMDTPLLSLPLLQPAQAQKHVTVNEALSVLDALSQITIASVSMTTPPIGVTDGTVFSVPQGAVNAWTGEDGNLAIAINGGWRFVTPRRGWRAMVDDIGVEARYDGTNWRLGAQTLTPGGAGMSLRAIELDVAITEGPVVTSPVLFPERSIAFGVTGRVIDEISGTAQSWEIGVVGDTGRYGTGLGLTRNAWVNGPSTPLVYWAPTPVVIGAVGGAFTGGTIRIVAHVAELALPRAV